MNYLFIIIPVMIIGVILFYVPVKEEDAYFEEEDPLVIKKEPKFQPRKITDLSKGTLDTDLVVAAPKKKYYKKRKKKPSTNVVLEKKPVGRPRKNTE